MALEQKISKHAAKRGAVAHLVSSGDLIDRGRDSAGVVRHLREGVAAGTHTVVFGNHEQILLEILRQFAPRVWGDAGIECVGRLRDYREMHDTLQTSARYLDTPAYLEMRRLLWVAEGGGATLASYGCSASDPTTWTVPAADLRFLATRPLLWETEHAFVTHALCDLDALNAVRAHQGGTGPEPTFAQVMSIIWGRKLPQQRLDPNKWHVSGHMAAKRVRVKRALGCVQVDSACVFGYKLSAWCAETEDILSVKAGAG